MLDPDSDGNETGAYFCVLPVTKDIFAIRDTYYPDLSVFSKPKTETARLTELFEGMGTLVPFGWAKSTEAIGGIATPDTNVALLSSCLLYTSPSPRDS